jgi:hypothetical protein
MAWMAQRVKISWTVSYMTQKKKVSADLWLWSLADRPDYDEDDLDDEGIMDEMDDLDEMDEMDEEECVTKPSVMTRLTSRFDEMIMDHADGPSGQYEAVDPGYWGWGGPGEAPQPSAHRSRMAGGESARMEEIVVLYAETMRRRSGICSLRYAIGAFRSTIWAIRCPGCARSSVRAGCRARRCYAQ